MYDALKIRVSHKFRIRYFFKPVSLGFSVYCFGLTKKVAALRCSYRFGQDGSVTFICEDWESCCSETCCPQTEAFYQLWYFWFAMIALTVFVPALIYICWQRFKQWQIQDALAASRLNILAARRKQALEEQEITFTQ